MQPLDESSTSLDEERPIVSPKGGLRKEAAATAKAPNASPGSLLAVVRLLARAAARDWLGTIATVQGGFDNNQRSGMAPAEGGRKSDLT
jgi:hypothetical protein